MAMATFANCGIDMLLAGHLHIGHEEHVFVRGARKCDAAQLAHGAARAIASGNPGHAQGVVGPVCQLERCGHAFSILVKTNKFSVPLHGHAQLA